MDEYVSFDAFDDCYITIDDFAYLQSFAAQNNFYLPNYFLEEIFQENRYPQSDPFTRRNGEDRRLYV